MPCAGAQDQVANMRAKGVPAAQLCSTLTAAERGATLAALQANELRLLYITPELLATGWRVLPCMPQYLILSAQARAAGKGLARAALHALIPSS